MKMVRCMNIGVGVAVVALFVLYFGGVLPEQTGLQNLASVHLSNIVPRFNSKQKIPLVPWNTSNPYSIPQRVWEDNDPPSTICQVGGRLDPFATEAVLASPFSTPLFDYLIFPARNYSASINLVGNFSLEDDEHSIRSVKDVVLRYTNTKAIQLSPWTTAIAGPLCDIILFDSPTYLTLSRSLNTMRRVSRRDARIVFKTRHGTKNDPLHITNSISLARIYMDTDNFKQIDCKSGQEWCILEYRPMNVVVSNRTSKLTEARQFPTDILKGITQLAMNNGGIVVFGSTNLGYINLTLASDCAIRSVGVNNLIYQALDRETSAFLENWNLERVTMNLPPIVHFFDPEAADTAAYVEWKNPLFVQLMFSRLRTLIGLIDLGFDVFLSDSDIIHLKNPFEEMKKDLINQGAVSSYEDLKSNPRAFLDDFDMLIQLDTFRFEESYAKFMTAPEGCGGFFLLRSTVHSRNILRYMVQAYDRHPTKERSEGPIDDQDMLNWAMRDRQFACPFNIGPKPFTCARHVSSNVTNMVSNLSQEDLDYIHVGWKFHYLQQSLFLNGHTFYEAWNAASKSKILPSSVHMNGKGKLKEEQFRKYKLWPIKDGECQPGIMVKYL